MVRFFKFRNMTCWWCGICLFLGGCSVTPNDILLKAAKTNDIETAQKALTDGAHVNATTRNNDPPLIAAIKNGHIPAIKFLIHHGADVNIRDKDEIPALMTAVSEGNLPVTELLLEKGADPNMNSFTTGLNALMGAILLRQQVPEFVTLLLKYGANVNARTWKGMTPLMYSVLWGDIEVIKLLIEHGAHINAHGDAYSGGHLTVLMLAVTLAGNIENSQQKLNVAKYIDVARLLIDYGADVNAKTVHGTTTLMEAVFTKSVEGVKLLIEHGADVNVKIPYGEYAGNTALSIAYSKGYTEIVRILKNFGASW